MNIACIGGGPAGLYLGILVKRRAPEHDVVVYERNRAADTFGFGVVFSDATLGHLASADPETHAEITNRFARWDDIEIHAGGEVLRSTGHGFCGIERKALLQILQARAAALGVRLEFEHEVRSLAELSAGARPADVIVACDGAASWVRDALASDFAPRVDVRPNKFVWLGSTVPYRAFTFLFKQTPHGLFRVHAYRYHERGSTFIVECREDTWRRAGLADASEDATVAALEAIFADELAGHRLIKNRSIWRNFPTVRCGRWHAGNAVLMGDAAHTAHFSIGSGTKLAMEDAIALADELLGGRDIASALSAYEARRRPEVEALQAAAQASLEWFEGTERYAQMAPIQFAYSLMTRSLRVSHASVGRRDPHLARGVACLLAASLGVTGEPPPPSALPLALGDRRARSRLALSPWTAPDARAPAPVDAAKPTAAEPARTAHAHPAPLDETLAALAGAASEAGLVVTPRIPIGAPVSAPVAAQPAWPGLDRDDQVTAWQPLVADAHAAGVLIAARLAVSACAHDQVAKAVARATHAGFDALVLDPYEVTTTDVPVAAAARTSADPPTGDVSDDRCEAVEQLPAVVAAARAAWRPGGSIAAVVRDRPAARAAVLGHAAQLVRAGADLLWIAAAPGAGSAHQLGARLPAAPLADRLRNELGVATAIECSDALLPDLDAAIAAGRADLVVVDRMPDGARRAP